MNKFAEITVIEWKNGKDAETFANDDDFREGTKTGELAGKTRITWADNKTVEWVKTDMLDKLDNRHLQLIRDIPVSEPVEPETDNKDNTDKPVEQLETDSEHATVEAIENAMKLGESLANDSKPSKRTRTVSK